MDFEDIFVDFAWFPLFKEINQFFRGEVENVSRICFYMEAVLALFEY